MIVAIARMAERPLRFIVAINLVNIPLQPHLQYLLVYHHFPFLSLISQEASKDLFEIACLCFKEPLRGGE